MLKMRKKFAPAARKRNRLLMEYCKNYRQVYLFFNSTNLF